MKTQVKVLATILLSLYSNFAFSNACPNVPKNYYPGPGASPVYGRYNDGSYPTNVVNNGILTVTWPYEGAGYVVYQDIGIEIHIPETITSNFYFTSAPNVICNSQVLTYSINDDCGTSFSWVAPTGWSINGGGNTLVTSSKSVSITAPSSGGGTFTIRVTPNTSFQRSTTTWLGQPQNPSSISGPSVANEGSFYSFSINKAKGTQSYNWTWPSGWSAESSTTVPTAWATPYTNSGYVTVTTTNSCGSGGTSSKYVTVNTCSNCLMSVYPNPAVSYIRFEERDSNYSDQIDFQIYDRVGNPVVVGATEFSNEINLANLSPGLYTVVFQTSNGKKEAHQFIIKR